MKITPRIVAHAQGSEAWHQHRATHLNASELAVVMGLSPYRTRAELVRIRATGVEPEIDAMTARRFAQGHEFEAIAREWADEMVDEPLYPSVLAADVDGLPLSASLDGQTLGSELIFEHKSGRADLLASLEAGVIPEHYHPQMEQGLLLSGADRCLFMASSGDREAMRFAWYTSRPELRAQIVPAWRQFLADVQSYTAAPAAADPAPVGKAPDTLPALRIELTGQVTASNLAEFKATALGAIRSVNRTLKTDQDFADAEKAVKWCADVEARLKAAKEHALSQTASIDELFRALDEIAAESKAVRLDIDKLVTRRKTEVKEEAVSAARRALDAHIATLNAEIAPMRVPTQVADFAGAIKGLRSIASMQDALDTTLAGAKIAADAQARVIRGNVATFKAQAAGLEFLFADLGAVVHKAADDFAMLVDARIAKHRADEAAREIERQRQEAERIAAAERRATAEAEARVRAEQEAMARKQREAEEAERLRLRDEQDREDARRRALQLDAQAKAAPAPIPTQPVSAAEEPATLKLGAICERLGFTVTAAFLADTLHVKHSATDKAARLYRESDWPVICRQLTAHINAVREVHASEAFAV